MVIGDLVKVRKNNLVIGMIIRGGFAGIFRWWMVYDGTTSPIHEDGCIFYFERDLEVINEKTNDILKNLRSKND